MLSSLQIENVAVIQKANVHFEKVSTSSRARRARANPFSLIPSTPFLATVPPKIWCVPVLQRR